LESSATPAFVVVPTTVEIEGVVDLLDLTVGGTDPERLGGAYARYRAGSAEFAAVFTEDSPIGVDRIARRVASGVERFRTVPSGLDVPLRFGGHPVC
jgi:hypothetical protein